MSGLSVVGQMCMGNRCLSPGQLPFCSQHHSDAPQDMSQSLSGFHHVSDCIVSPGELVYIRSGHALVSEDHHREGTRALAFSTSLSWNCVVVCPVLCLQRSSFAVLGETILLLTSSLWNKMTP